MPGRVLVTGLTKAQREVVEWAEGAMRDYWQDREEREAEGAQVIDDPIRVMKHGVEIVIDRPVLEDLKYRLLFQYPDLCEDEPNRAALIRAAEKAWQVLSEAAQLMGIDDIKVPLFETLPDSE